MVKVTVYITNYNYENYIEQSIESVLSQSDVDFELLIIDDGSTDNSKSIIERYRDRPEVQIIYQKNKGLNITNNIALRLAQGKYIMRLDADDYLEQDALASMANILDERDDMGLVFPDYYIVDAKGQRLEHIKRHNFDSEVSLFDVPAHGACTLIRTDNLKALGGYNENYTCQDGYELWIKFISQYKVTNISKPLFNYRRHGSNLTNNEGRILATRAKIHQEHVEKKYGQLNAIAIIPIRMDGKANKLALSDLGDKKLLDFKINAAFDSEKVRHIIISSPDLDIGRYITQRYPDSERIHFHYREKALARINQDLNASIQHIIDDHQHLMQDITTIALLYQEYPFIQAQTIDDAINALYLFDSDTLISIREDSRMLFQHDGSGLKPILEHDRFTKLERETVYKFSGGTTVMKVDSWNKNRNVMSGKIGHIHITDLESIHVNNLMELDFARLLIESKTVEV